MFIGHFGVGFAAKRAAPRVSLGSFFVAAQFIDLLWPTFLLLGIEHVRIAPGITRVTPLDFVDYPISHSLLMVAGWSVLVAGTHYFLVRYPRGAFALGAAVISHWLLDALVHRPDLPLAPGGSTLVGLGAWSSVALTLAIEVPIFAAGLWLYVRTTRPIDAVGKWALAGLAAFLLVIYAANLIGPPPPDVTTLAFVGHAQWLLVAWGYWVDRHRRVSPR
jgi:hypothetical protein